MLSLVPVISAHLVTALAGAAGDSAHASAHAVREPRPTARATTAAGILGTAARQVGTPYRLGGTKPNAFDCSGLVRYVFARHGVSLPRTAREQSLAGRAVLVGLDSLRVGDLLFFDTKRGRATHVAIYAGAGRIIHASAGTRRVRYDDLDSPRGRWFITHLSRVRRVLDG